MATATLCPHCRQPATDIGHVGRDYREPGDVGGVCLSMNLTRNHCIYFGRQLTDPTYQRDRCPCWTHKKWRADCARAQLARCIIRAEEVWPAEKAGWLDAYRPLAQAPAAPDHHAVPVTEQLDLLAGA